MVLFHYWNAVTPRVTAAMDKDRDMLDNLQQGILDTAGLDEDTIHRYVSFMRELRHPQGIPVGVAAERLRQWLEEVRARGQSDLLRNCQLWLNELILGRKVILVRPQMLLQWLLDGRQQDKTPVELNLILTVLKTLPKEELRLYWRELATFPYSNDVSCAVLVVQCQDLVLADLEQSQDGDTNSCRQLANTLINHFYEGVWLKNSKEEQWSLLLSHSLHLLQRIVAKQPDFAAQNVPELMGLVQTYMIFGTEEASARNQPPRRVQPAQQSAAYGQDDELELEPQPSQKQRTGGRKNKTRKMRSLARQRNQSTNDVQETNPRDRLLLTGHLDYGCLTGDSGENCPVSDSAGDPQSSGLRQERNLQAKVRISALHLLGSLAKHLPRRFLYGYWHILFPSGEHGATNSHLLLLGHTDTNARCRAVALQLAAQILYGSKSFLSQASSQGPSNYTPFAMSLASSLMSSYRCLSSILEREYAPPVLTQGLKCLAVLVQATPFEQLEMGFVYEFVGHVKKLAKSGDIPVVVSALLVMEMLLSSPRLTPEMASAVGLSPSQRNLQLEDVQGAEQDYLDSDADVEFEEDAEPEPSEQSEKPTVPADHTRLPPIPRNSWLLRQVLRYLESLGTAPPIRVECYQVLLAMGTHIGLLRGHQTRLCRVIMAGLGDATFDVRLYAARCLDSVGYQLGRLVPESSERESQLSFWLHLLPVVYTAYHEAAGASLKCALCDALSNIGTFTFERLSLGHRNALLAFLSGCASDDGEEPLVRAAALRAMAVYVLHPSLKGDLVFVENAAELSLYLVNDTQLVVRTKAAWALGNISDALLGGVSQHSERISEELLGRLIQAATKSCGDHDKVKANAVRSLGNLLQVLQLQPGANSEQMQMAISKLLDCVKNASSAKVKWNACHAIGNLVRHRAFFATNHLAGILFPALSQLIVQHANFKVRINATAVLLQLEQRQDLGNHFALVWRSILEALERSNALDSFEEYNHRDALQQQLCLAIAKLLALAKAADLPGMREALEEDRLEAVRSTWRRVAYRIVPEQSAPLFTCIPLLEQRLQAETVLPQQRSSLAFVARNLKLDP